METQWTPKTPDGASLRTHKLVTDFGSPLKFQMSLGTTLFCDLFVLIGIAILVGGVVKPVNGSKIAFVQGMMCVPGANFGVAGSGLFYVMNKPIVFDKDTRYFWKGRRSPRLDLMGKQSKGLFACMTSTPFNWSPNGAPVETVITKAVITVTRSISFSKMLAVLTSSIMET